jgi:hypothetical protein
MHSTQAARPARARRYAMLAGFATAMAWPLGAPDAQPAQTVPPAPAAADPAGSAAIRLPELRVEGARETATGPVAGYVA